MINKTKTQKRSDIVKKAIKGKDIGKKGKTFKEVEEKATEYYLKTKKYTKEKAKEIGKKIASSQMWKSLKLKK